MSDLKAQLQELVDTAEWSWLMDHAEKGRVLIITPKLDLVEVGLALAEDNISLVKQWLDDSWIYRPTADQVHRWDETPNLSFASLIVQPFVLIKIPSTSEQLN